MPSSSLFCPDGKLDSAVKMLLLIDVAKLFWREMERSTLDSPLLDPLLSSGSNSAGKAQA